ncbi:MAG: type II toxin-antitoxin system VapC family toxin [Bacillota bacterium]|nr:type II toxin-antitoxin system VapC family toxin [Bacillota bacterium]
MEVTVDASVVLAVILNEPSKAQLLEVTGDVDLVAAPTLPWEVGNALSALFKRARLSLLQAKSAVDSFERIALRLADVDLLAAVELAEKHRIYAYDAYVLECARRYRTPLLSLDGPQREVGRRMGLEIVQLET